MTDCDALIVGGGPAGSTCARALRQAGWDVTVIDRAGFPRDKVCAGWLTPDVFRLLDLAPAEYRAAGLTLQEIVGFRTGLLRGPSVETPYGRVVSYAVRRREFDEFLLRRAGVRVLEQTPLTSLRCDGHIWVVNEEIQTPLVIGAGGHFCPVARRAGLAYPESGEGIRPAIESGVMAAETLIAAAGDYSRATLQGYEVRLRARASASVTPTPTPALEHVSATLGTWLLRRSWFVRNVVLNRWFLGRHQGSTF